MAITELAYRKMKMREGDAPRLMSRVYNGNGSLITQATFAGGGTIDYSIFDLKSATPSVAAASGNLTVADAIYDSLQLDGTWREDETGYNFGYQFAASNFEMSGYAPGRFIVEVRGVPQTGEPFWIGGWDIDVFPMLSA